MRKAYSDGQRWQNLSWRGVESTSCSKQMSNRNKIEWQDEREQKIVEK
jgi:hypothetical protein